MKLTRLTFVILLVLAVSVLPSCSKETLKDSKKLQDHPRLISEEGLTATPGSLMKLSKTWMESGPCTLVHSQPVVFFWHRLDGKAGTEVAIYQQPGGVGALSLIATTSDRMGGGTSLCWSAFANTKYYLRISYGNAFGWVSKIDLDEYRIATIPGTSVSVGMKISRP